MKKDAEVIANEILKDAKGLGIKFISTDEDMKKKIVEILLSYKK